MHSLDKFILCIGALIMIFASKDSTYRFGYTIIFFEIAVALFRLVELSTP